MWDYFSVIKKGSLLCLLQNMYNSTGIMRDKWRVDSGSDGPDQTGHGVHLRRRKCRPPRDRFGPTVLDREPERWITKRDERPY